MSLTSLLDSITRRQRERKKSKWSDYRQLVADICDGKEPDADRIASVLADNQCTLDELRSDAKLLEKRRKLRAEMDAIEPLRDEAAKVERQIKKGEKEFEALSEKHKAEMSPLYARRFEISQIRKRSDRAREELRDTCEDRELLEGVAGRVRSGSIRAKRCRHRARPHPERNWPAASLGRRRQARSDRDRLP